MSKIEKKTALINNLMYVALGVAGLGLLLFLIGCIAGSVGSILLGILFILGGGAFALWMLYYLVDLKRTLKLFRTVLDGKKKTISQIAKECDMQKLDVRQQVDQLIREGDLEDYMRIGEAVVLKTEYEANLDAEKNPGVAVKCSSCGASFLLSGETGACPYCQTFVNAQK